MAGETGLTASEAYLGRLCRKAFLQLWSYPNLFKKPGTELCDVLVVFGDDVLIFSDKHCVLGTEGEDKTNWRRWYRDAIQKSARQVAGAERWIREHPERVYTDSRCTQRFPLHLPEKPVFHRILTCRGAAAASRAKWGGSGSLFVTNEPLAACAEKPFYLGAFDDADRMLHVFDEVALDEVLDTLDTTKDLCEYLRAREEFFRSGPLVVATGEEDLLGYYMFNHGSGHDHTLSIDRHVNSDDGTQPTMVMLDESFGSGWKVSRQRAEKAKADQISYCWDRLIEKTSHHLLEGTQHYPREADVREQERLVRWMAQENRVQRRMLAGALLEAMQAGKRRYVLPTRSDGPVWVFLSWSRPDGMDYEQYRERRRDMLRSYCLVAKFLNPEFGDIAGIAVDPQLDELSEDLLHLDAHEWPPELREHARQLHEDAGIFRKTERHESQHWEFPVPASLGGRRAQRRRVGKERKRRRRASRASRRRNRR